jgi:hypothetical protein
VNERPPNPTPPADADHGSDRDEATSPGGEDPAPSDESVGAQVSDRREKLRRALAGDAGSSTSEDERRREHEFLRDVPPHHG